MLICSFNRGSAIRLFAAITLSLSMFPGCRKDTTAPLQQPATPPSGQALPAYRFPLTIGSYWIYEHVLLDQNLNVLSTGAVDSVFICADTLIHNDTFYVFGQQTFGSPVYSMSSGFINESYYLRDSAGYLVHPSGSAARASA